MHSSDSAVARCLSVRLSVTRQYSIKTAEYIITLFEPLGSHTILVFPYQTVWQYSHKDPPPLWRRGMQGVWKSRDFRPICRFLSELKWNIYTRQSYSYYGMWIGDWPLKTSWSLWIARVNNSHSGLQTSFTYLLSDRITQTLFHGSITKQRN